MDLTPNVKEKGNTILFNSSKNELFKISENYKTLHRKLKGSWKVLTNKDDISSDVLSGVTLFVIPGPREKFTESEFNSLKKYLDSGGNILILVGEGGEKNFQTNVNFLLEEYGIMINTDCVVRTHYYKYFHPKECLVANGILNRAIAVVSGKFSGSDHYDHNISQTLKFVYPYGATLNVARPAVAVLSTGSVAFPLNRPVCAFYTHTNTTSGSPGGKLAVLGSVHIFSDKYIDKEDNDIVRDVLFRFLTSSDIKLNQIDADDPEITDYIMVPDTARLAEKPRVCLQESVDEIPTDYTKLFNQRLFSINTGCVPAAIQAYHELNVKHEPLRLITPQFETPLPPLQAAVFPPSFRELPPPNLELFDLDEAFSSEKSHLAQLANKCLSGGDIGNDEADLEYFIRECGQVLGVGGSNRASGLELDARQVLHSVSLRIAEFKKLGHLEE
ncbi:intraflagellar transport protein 52 homolog isoform X2 [Zootermopsis nevadensis]|uniref:intraflagellar transport protein 52 homolog isoform X2 n=1 Tax=Zootermopsis nevadensis TaxID=136037 RepID=UPI000B8EA8FE|nr:intraflagellar transport protein 52 homolog isoform X2 [Zootermopsis nevadensis]